MGQSLEQIESLKGTFKQILTEELLSLVNQGTKGEMTICFDKEFNSGKTLNLKTTEMEAVIEAGLLEEMADAILIQRDPPEDEVNIDAELGL